MSENPCPVVRRCARRQLGRRGDPRMECAAAERRQLSRAYPRALLLDRSRHGARTWRERKVIALDGDGSLLMNLCSLPTIARMKPKNLLHMVFDNEVYEASGSKKTATGAGADLVGLARAAGIENAHWANSLEAFARAAERALVRRRAVFHRRQGRRRARRGRALSDRRSGKQVSLHPLRRKERQDRNSQNQLAGELRLSAAADYRIA